MELKGGSVPVPLIEIMDSDVSKKWAEFENLSFRDMSAQSLIGVQDYQSSTVQASQSHCTSQMYRPSPEEAKEFVTVSETDISSSKAALQSINGTHVIQTNTAEALHKEVRQNLESLHHKGKKQHSFKGVTCNRCDGLLCLISRLSKPSAASLIVLIQSVIFVLSVLIATNLHCYQELILSSLHLPGPLSSTAIGEH